MPADGRWDLTRHSKGEGKFLYRTQWFSAVEWIGRKR